MTIVPAQWLGKVRERKPVVHHLTNWVTIYDCAQVVKSLGASPVMAHAVEEVGDMVGIASALVLNIGTLTPEFLEAMIVAGRAANERGIPVVLDACGAGASRLRDGSCRRLLKECRIGILKGNRSEVARVAGHEVATRGVDTGEIQIDLVELGRKAAQALKTTVVITGETDVVTDGQVTCLVANGHPLMAAVVGTGCMAASVIGAFAAVAPASLVEAAVSALVCFEVAGELAAQANPGPSAFKLGLLDALYVLDEKTVGQRQQFRLL